MLEVTGIDSTAKIVKIAEVTLKFRIVKEYLDLHLQ